MSERAQEVFEEAKAIQALLDISHYVGDVGVHTSRTHETTIRAGGHVVKGDWVKVRPRVIAWAELLRDRDLNLPIPAPPES